MILAALVRLKCLRDCVGEGVAGATFTPATTAVEIRAADSLAKSVYVYNAGLREAAVYEAGGLVFYLAGQTGAELPMQGLLAIAAKATGDEFAELAAMLSYIYDAGNGWTTITWGAQNFATQVGDTLRVGSLSVFTDHVILSFPGAGQVRVAGQVTGGGVQIIRLQTRAEVTAYTVRRCLCGDTVVYYDDAPVGAFLL